MTLDSGPMDVNGPIFEEPETLPRGPHDLSRDEVRASQANRLFAAIAGLVAEVGYPAVTIGAIAGRAGVSRATFYEHFINKEACYVAAYERFGEVLATRIATAIPETDAWTEVVDAALDAYLGTLDADRAAARAFVLEIDGVGPTARAAGRRLYGQMANFVRGLHEDIRRGRPDLGALPPESYTALVHGLRGLVRDVLDTQQEPTLVDLVPSLGQFTRAIILGAAAVSGADGSSPKT